MNSFNDKINIIEEDTFNLYKTNESLSLYIKEFNNIYKNKIKQNNLNRKKAIKQKKREKNIQILIQEKIILNYYFKV